MNYNEDLFSGSWVLDLFRNVVINYQITHLRDFVDLNEFKKWKRNTCKITEKRLERIYFEYVRLCKFTDN